MRRLVLCMFCAMACEFGVAQTFDEAAMKGRLDQVASSYSGKNKFMGTVLLARRDRILLNKGYGMANLEWQIPNAPHTSDVLRLFRVGAGSP